MSSKDRFAYFQAPGQQFKRSIQLFASKSELIRAFHLKSFEPGLQVMGESFAEDVLTAQKSYSDFLQGSTDFFVGESGALLRFLLFRVSRRPGRYSIRGAPSLFSRPHQEARNILAQLGIELEMKKKSIEVVSQGWRKPSKPVRVSLSMSSQFLSGLILSSLDLDFEFEVWIEGPKVSESYFRITIAMLDHLGIKLKIFDEKRIIIPKNQRIQSAYYVCDWDWSSIFTLAAYAARGGALEVPWCWSLESIIHPDVAFIKIFKEMGILVSENDLGVKIGATNKFSGVNLNSLNNPDLVPVLATLAVFAETDSTFTGVSHLSYKESNRLERVVDLITKAGGQAWVGEFKGQKRLCVKGKGAGFRPNKFSYDPRPDHRLWMAAQLFKFANPEIEVSHPEVCAKSFPDLPQWVKQI